MDLLEIYRMLQNRSANTYIIIGIMLVMMSSSARAGNIFHLEPVQYFQQVKSKSRLTTQDVMDWREPMLGPDGGVSYYQPPKAVLELLNHPTPENARSYLEWQRKKMERIFKAQEIVTSISQAEGS